MHPFKLTGFCGRLSVVGSSKLCLVFALFLRFRVPSVTFLFSSRKCAWFLLFVAVLFLFCFVSADVLQTQK